MKLIVDNMTCNHCVKAVTKAINDVDPKAKVSVDLTKKEVTIDGGSISQEAAIKGVDDAGYQFVGISY